MADTFNVSRSGGLLSIEFSFDEHLRAHHNERGFVKALRNGDLHRIIQHNIDYDEPFFENDLADVIALFPELSDKAFRYGPRSGYYIFEANTNDETEWDLFTHVRDLLLSRECRIREFNISEALVKIIFVRD